MNKRLFLLLFCLMTALSAIHAQQLTRFAVVDLPRVYTTFFRDSRAVRDFEERSARVQSDIDRMSEEIKELEMERLEAEAASDQDAVLRLDNQIYRKSEYLKEYYRLKTAELEDQRKRLTQSGTFLQQVYDEIKLVAESEGYSMVLNLKENAGILWHSPTVDITDKVIQNLMTKAGR